MDFARRLALFRARRGIERPTGAITRLGDVQERTRFFTDGEVARVVKLQRAGFFNGDAEVVNSQGRRPSRQVLDMVDRYCQGELPFETVRRALTGAHHGK